MNQRVIRRHSLIVAVAAAIGSFGWIAGAQAATDPVTAQDSIVVAAHHEKDGDHGDMMKNHSDGMGMESRTNPPSEQDADSPDGNMSGMDSGGSMSSGSNMDSGRTKQNWDEEEPMDPQNPMGAEDAAEDGY